MILNGQVTAAAQARQLEQRSRWIQGDFADTIQDSNEKMRDHAAE
jgi:hypothetical protein